LLRDAWEQVNLAGVNVSRLNHEIALAAFRQRAEEVATEVIAAYWVLLQARRDLKIQQELLDRTLETLRKLEGRKEIDATAVEIKQTEASLKAREAALIQAGKRVFDVQDALLRLLADTQINLLEELEIIPVTLPTTASTKYETIDILALAILNNPVIQQRRVAVSIADINIEVAENRRMPRLDLVASARTQTLTRGYGDAHDRLDDGNFVSYAVGLSFEYPLGNRQRQAELRRRRFERSKAVSDLQNIADQIATQAKERIRRLETNYQEMQVQKDAVEAAKTHLQALEDTEAIREKLTPEFLLVKLQSQENLAGSQRAEIRATVDYNVSLARLAQTTGTVLQLHHVQAALPLVAGRQNISDN
jgi:outer membrane protein TolC